MCGLLSSVCDVIYSGIIESKFQRNLLSPVSTKVIKATDTSETWVQIYQSIWHYIPGSGNVLSVGSDLPIRLLSWSVNVDNNHFILSCSLHDSSYLSIKIYGDISVCHLH